VDEVQQLAFDTECNVRDVAQRREAEQRGAGKTHHRRARLALDLEVLVCPETRDGDG